MEEVVEQTDSTTGDTEYITIDKLEKPPKPKLHNRKAKKKTPTKHEPTTEVDVLENVTNASEGEESFDGSMDELDSEFEENETGPSRAPKRRKVFSNNDRLKSEGKRQAEALRSSKRRKVDAKSDGAKAGGKSETEVSRSPTQRKVDAKCVHAKSDGDESDSAPDDGSSKKVSIFKSKLEALVRFFLLVDLGDFFFRFRVGGWGGGGGGGGGGKKK